MKKSIFNCEVCQKNVPISGHVFCISMQDANSPFSTPLPNLGSRILYYCEECFEAVAGDDIISLIKQPSANTKPSKRGLFTLAPPSTTTYTLTYSCSLPTCTFTSIDRTNFKNCVNLCDRCFNGLNNNVLLHPACKKCGSACVLRVNKGRRGMESAFWGCSKYPTCLGTRKVQK